MKSVNNFTITKNEKQEGILTKMKFLYFVFSVLFSLILVSCIGIKSQIKKHTGEKTEVVDFSKFSKDFDKPIAITNVSILSENCTEMLNNRTVLISNGKIESIGVDLKVPKKYSIINGKNQFLIPGLIDTHVHLVNSKNDLLLYLANGITSVAEMFGNERHLEWREESKTNKLYPNLFVSTVKLGSTSGFMPKIKSWYGGRQNYTTEKQARKAVKDFKLKGYDAIKLSSFLNPEIYSVLVDESIKQEIPAIGHISAQVGLERFFLNGQSQIGHIEEIVKNLQDEFGLINSDNTEEFIRYVKDRADEISIRLKENNITITSTIWLMESIPQQSFYCNQFIKEIELEYANPGLVEGSKLNKGWLPGNNGYENLEINNDPNSLAFFKKYWRTFVEAIHIVTKSLIKYEVTILAGTDANTTGVVPGFSLHAELNSLSNQGLSNSKILEATTVNAAKWMKFNTGKIKEGYEADLILLEYNPLDDINNTKSIKAVINNGALFKKEELDEILNAVKNVNNKSRNIVIDKYN